MVATVVLTYHFAQKKLPHLRQNEVGQFKYQIKICVEL